MGQVSFHRHRHPLVLPQPVLPLVEPQARVRAYAMRRIPRISVLWQGGKSNSSTRRCMLPADIEFSVGDGQ
jgi:hypothetical protein